MRYKLTLSLEGTSAEIDAAWTTLRSLDLFDNDLANGTSPPRGDDEAVDHTVTAHPADTQFETPAAIHERLSQLDAGAAALADRVLPPHARGSLLWTAVFALASLPERPGFDPGLRDADTNVLSTYILGDLAVRHTYSGEHGVKVFASSLSAMCSKHAFGGQGGYDLFVRRGRNRIGLAERVGNSSAP